MSTNSGENATSSNFLSADNLYVDELMRPNTPVMKKMADLESIKAQLLPRFKFPEITTASKTEFAAYVIGEFPAATVDLKLLLLEVLRILFRDEDGIDAFMSIPLAKLLVEAANLAVNENPQVEAARRHEPFNVGIEAVKCLINGLFHSAIARNVFEAHGVNGLVQRITVLNKIVDRDVSKAPPEFQYLTKLTQPQLYEQFFLDLRLAFIISALSLNVQYAWITDTSKTLLFLDVVKKASVELSAIQPGTRQIEWLNEGFKVLFNTYCHAKIFDTDIALQVANECARIAIGSTDPETRQNAINVIATIPTTATSLCPKISEGETAQVDPSQIYEGHDVRFAWATLDALDKRMDTVKPTDVDLLGTYFTVLIALCKNHKAARRYCRLKVLPPLKASHVERPPQEGTSLRNKIVRIMSGASTCCELAAEFMFVLCKRSVGRLIKYTGFGHSAGLLANYGFLGAAVTAQRSASDSEDSETEDYKEVEDRINPITGYIQPPRQNPFEGMSDEQKEYEAVRLANAMSKLMDEGVFAPAQIGPDGRPQAVQHVLELIKDQKVENSENSDVE